MIGAQWAPRIKPDFVGKAQTERVVTQKKPPIGKVQGGSLQRSVATKLSTMLSAR